MVDIGTLTLGRRLGQGGQGAVHAVENKKINKDWDVVYKEYNPTSQALLDDSALTAMVDLLSDLNGDDGQWLCEKTAWPAAVVERDGDICGFLMRAVPDRFQFVMQSLGGSGTGTRRLANLEFLLNDDVYLASIGLRVSERDRLALLADLAATLTRLHHLGITVGDLSPKNLLFTMTPQPEVFLIDCDAMRLNGTTALPQAETPDWQIPDGEEKATQVSDVYKFALLAVRLTAQDQTTTDPAALTASNPALGDLARSSLSTDPASRPSPAMWSEQLTAALPNASTALTPASPPRPTPAAPPPSYPDPLPRPTPDNSTIWIGVAVVAVFILSFVALAFYMSAPRTSSTYGSSTYTPSYRTPTYTYTLPTTTWSRPTTTVKPPPPVNVGDCIEVDSAGALVGSGNCDVSHLPYRVTAVKDNYASCDDPESASITEDGYQLCLEIHMAERYCYNIPEQGGWVTPALACRTPGSSHVIDIVPGATNDRKCTRRLQWNWWYAFTHPNVVYCVMRY
jgi:serine/threonine protein kinase